MKNFEIRSAISKLRLSSNKLTVVTGKWRKIKNENRVSKFCNFNAIEDIFHFLTDHPNYKKLKESTLEYIEHTEHTYLSRGNITMKLKELY